MEEKIESTSPAQTEALGEKLGQAARAGEIYCLCGDLGVGKTVFTKGFAKGLGVEDVITSPTFTIVNEYQGRLPFYHFDVYRISCEEEMDDIGYEEYFFGDGVCLIEWAELIAGLLPPDAVQIRIEKDYAGGDEDYRRITIARKGEKP